MTRMHDRLDRRRSAAAELTSPVAATLRLDTSRDVTSRARQGGAGDTAGTQTGLIKLISAPVAALVSRAQQQGCSGTAKSAFERRNVWREKCSLNPRNGQPLRPHPTRYGTCNGNFMCRFALPPVLVKLVSVSTEPLRMVGVRFWSTSYFVPK